MNNPPRLFFGVLCFIAFSLVMLVACSPPTYTISIDIRGDGDVITLYGGGSTCIDGEQAGGGSEPYLSWYHELPCTSDGYLEVETFIAEPAPGQVFYGWSNACADAPTCEFNIHLEENHIEVDDNAYYHPRIGLLSALFIPTKTITFL